VDGGLIDLDAKARAIPIALKRFLWARDQTCRAPGCGRAAGRCDIDHVRRWEHQGPTLPENLALLCRSHHEIKDEGYWEVRLLPDGSVLWRSHWGTERIVRPAIRPAPPPEVPSPF
jgi:hypothetical protein